MTIVNRKADAKPATDADKRGKVVGGELKKGQPVLVETEPQKAKWVLVA